MGEWLRRWIGPIATVMAMAVSGFSAYRGVLEAIATVKTEASRLVSDVKYDVLSTTKDVQYAVEQVKMSVGTLNVTVEDLRSKSDQLRDELPKGAMQQIRERVDENDRRIDKIEQDVVRINTRLDGIVNTQGGQR